jgi:RimJ/RimL family protein N-acetyltransferase
VSEPTSVEDGFRRVRSPFEGALVRLRAFEEDDIPRVNQLVWDPEVSRFLAMAWPESLSETRRFWERTRTGRAEGPTFVVETLPGELVGLCGLFDLRPRARTAELGIWIGRPYWNRGFGTDAVRTLSRFAVQEMNLARVALSVYESNVRGIRSYEKAGFKEEGRERRAHFIDGRHVDVVRMGLLAGELAEAATAG